MEKGVNNENTINCGQKAIAMTPWRQKGRDPSKNIQTNLKRPGISTTAANKAGPPRARLGSPPGESEQTKKQQAGGYAQCHLKV
jgi:hypothetical protein